MEQKNSNAKSGSKKATTKKPAAAKTTPAKKVPAKKPATAKKTTTAPKKASTSKTTVAAKKATAKKATTTPKKPVKVSAPAKKASAPKKVEVAPKEPVNIKIERKSESTTSKGVKRGFNIYLIQGFAFSLISIILGMVLLLKPAIATRSAEIITAIILIGLGIGSIFNYAMKDKIKIFKTNFILGIIACLLGVSILVNPFALSTFLTIAFGIFLFVNGIIKINYALKFKKLQENCWSLVLSMGLISSIFGIVIIINPFANLYFTQVVGLFMTLYGVMEFTKVLLFKKRSKIFLNLIK